MILGVRQRGTKGENMGHTDANEDLFLSGI